LEQSFDPAWDVHCWAMTLAVQVLSLGWLQATLPLVITHWLPQSDKGQRHSQGWPLQFSV
jgi:hypothetical protein